MYAIRSYYVHKALQIGHPGDIIVAATDGYPAAGYFGDLMATSATARQIGGLAIERREGQADPRDPRDRLERNNFV